MSSDITLTHIHRLLESFSKNIYRAKDSDQGSIVSISYFEIEQQSFTMPMIFLIDFANSSDFDNSSCLFVICYIVVMAMHIVECLHRM